MDFEKTSVKMENLFDIDNQEQSQNKFMGTMKPLEPTENKNFQNSYKQDIKSNCEIEDSGSSNLLHSTSIKLEPSSEIKTPEKGQSDLNFSSKPLEITKSSKCTKNSNFTNSEIKSEIVNCDTDNSGDSKLLSPPFKKPRLDPVMKFVKSEPMTDTEQDELVKKEPIIDPDEDMIPDALAESNYREYILPYGWKKICERHKGRRISKPTFILAAPSLFLAQIMFLNLNLAKIKSE